MVCKERRMWLRGIKCCGMKRKDSETDGETDKYLIISFSQEICIHLQNSPHHVFTIRKSTVVLTDSTLPCIYIKDSPIIIMYLPILTNTFFLIDFPIL